MKYLKLLYALYPALASLPEYRHAVRVVKKFGCKKVLDVGCGKGTLSSILLSKNLINLYVGIDLINMFKPRKHYAEVLISNGNYPPFRKFFDCVLFVNSIFYVGLNSLDKYINICKYVVIIDIDPKYPHVWVADRLESWGKGLRITRKELVSKLRKKYKICEEGGLVTYYVVVSKKQ